VTSNPRATQKAEPGRWYYQSSAIAANEPFVLLETVVYTPPEQRSEAMELVFSSLNPAYAKKPRERSDNSKPTFHDYLDRELRLFDRDTGRELFRFPSCDEWVISPSGKQLALRHGDHVQLWDLPPREPWVFIMSMAFLHTLLILGPCWYFVRRREADETAEGAATVPPVTGSE
jgi:hypothetical protein